MVGWGPVGIGYVRPVQFLDHLTVITILNTPVLHFVRGSRKSKGLHGAGDEKDH